MRRHWLVVARMRRHWFVIAAALVALATVDLALGAGAGYAARNWGSGARSSRQAVRTSAQSIEIRTVPVRPHLRFALAGHVFTTDRNGRTTVPAAEVNVVSLDLRTNPLPLNLLPDRRPDGSFFRLERWYTATRTRNAVVAALDLYRPVRFSLVSRTGRPISTALVDSFQMKRIDGEVINLTHAQLQRPVVLQASRVVPLSTALVSKNLLYRIMDVSIGGNSLVHRAQQFFLPSETVDVPVDPICIIHGLPFSEHECIYCVLCFRELTPEQRHILPDGTWANMCNPCVEKELRMYLARLRPACIAAQELLDLMDERKLGWDLK